MSVIDPVVHLHSLLAGASRYPRLRREAFRLLSTEREPYVKIALTAAVETSDPAGTNAATLLGELLEQDQDVELAEHIYELLPRKTRRLAQVAVTATERLLTHLFPTGAFDLVGAELLNNLSEWLADSGDLERAVEKSAASTKVFAKLARADQRHWDSATVAMLTHAKRLSGNGKIREAIRATEKAVRWAGRIVGGEPQTPLRRRSQAQVALATRLRETGKHLAALPPALAACDVLENFQRLGLAVEEDLALAHHLCANLLTDLGRHPEADPHAKAAYELYRSLVAKNEDYFLEFYLAAGNTRASSLSLQGEVIASQKIADDCVKYLQGAAAQAPHRFAREYAAYLINYADSHAEAGHFDIALIAAESGLEQAKALREVFGRRDLFLEGAAHNGLFNLKYSRMAFRPAADHAKRAIHCFRSLAESHGEYRIELVRAWRNLAEAQRGIARRPAENQRAVASACQAWSKLQQISKPWSEGTELMSAQCLTSMGLAHADAGQLGKAAESERASLEIRRGLFFKSPRFYIKELANSLRLVGQHELALGNPTVGLPFLTESVRHYRTAFRTTKSASVAVWLAEVHRLKARAYLHLQKGLKARSAYVDAINALELMPEGLTPGQQFTSDQIRAEYAKAIEVHLI